MRKAERQAQETERERRYDALWEGAIERLYRLPAHELEEVTTVPGVNSILAPEVSEASETEIVETEIAKSEPPATESPATEPLKTNNPIAWSKAAPLLVLPILRGEGLTYGLRQNWEAVTQQTASLLRVELPWDELMESEEEGELLRLLEAIAPTRLLVLGAALLLRQEASSAARFPAPTPLLEFVLDLQPARQTELEEPDQEESESESDEIESGEMEEPDENEAEDDGWEIEGLWNEDTEGEDTEAETDGEVDATDIEAMTGNGDPETSTAAKDAAKEGLQAKVSTAQTSAEAARREDIPVSEGGNDQGREEPDFESWNVGDEDSEDQDEDNWNDPQEDFEAD